QNLFSALQGSLLVLRRGDRRRGGRVVRPLPAGELVGAGRQYLATAALPHPESTERWQPRHSAGKPGALPSRIQARKSLAGREEGELRALQQQRAHSDGLRG